MTPITDRILQRTLEIQAIPAPTFEEHTRAEFVRAQFEAEGLETEIDEIGNVYAHVPGAANAKPLILSAHTDTVFPADTPLNTRTEGDKVYGPGIGDNSTAVAALFGVLWELRARGTTLPGDLWLVANVGEEGLGDLNGMRAVVERFGDTPAAYVVLEGMALGQVYHRALGVRRYRISTHTQGGHSWVNFGRPSAIHELTHIAHQIMQIEIPKNPMTSFNIGTISGGVSINTIAPTASLDLDLRSESPIELDRLASCVLGIVRQARRDGVEVWIETIGNRPTGELPLTHPLIELAKACLHEAGIAPNLQIGSTDANIPLSRGYPAVCVGLTKGGGAHTTEEYLLVSPMEKGLTQLMLLIERIFTNPALSKS
jgi:acetylornithine deacetylase/succinyl-diaminopimelate desuccinylase-like protein